ncbi:MAG TPA: alpha/beta hydrolase, partial [Candidatus Angelobacter sp.]|nr:alpha/beta hydrolase [Candidatus Angelobacter sp.]
GSFDSEELHIKFQELLAPMYAVTHDPNTKSKRKGKYSFEALNEGFGGFLRTYDVTSDIQHLTVPALIIGAQHDWITPVKHSYWMAKLIPNNEFVVLENSSHSVFKDEGDRTRDILIDFLKRRIIDKEMGETS